jgi:hypothetical protein
LLLFQLIDDILGGAHAKRKDGPGDIFIRLAHKGTAIYTKEIFTVVCLITGI